MGRTELIFGEPVEYEDFGGEAEPPWVKFSTTVPMWVFDQIMTEATDEVLPISVVVADILRQWAGEEKK